MTFFLRAVEQADGTWVCKRGLAVLASVPTLEAAIAHLKATRDTLEDDAEIRVHRLDPA